ncbi:MAG: hypothetical protein KDA27_07395 [Candidatus Eisenbacteria bacterium]|uniref:Cytochrome c-552/DMSO reductase-like haem-binding domain-containing protein n=1 Tax=Eiseniibacteriota bacterium TaxID=2212470 RepID=A0A956NDT0_UNCEI|nr:hypothetical protein [Candidatus Eisenbacteria bacterium]
MRPSNAEILGVILTLILTTGGVALGIFRGWSHAAQVSEEVRARRSDAWREAGKLVIRLVDDLPAVASDDVWSEAPVRSVEVRPQVVTMPILEDTTATVVEVQAVTDGRTISWRLSWMDPVPDTATDSGRFTDAVALQFPVSRNASFMMGGRDQRVQILHWKGIWQRDVEEGFQDVQDLHPNYWADLYWFAEAGGLPRVPDSFRDERSHAWFPAMQAGNPFSQFDRAQPIEELTAEGFGSLTSQPSSASWGSGAWADGRWTVVVSRPLRTDDSADYQFTRGMIGNVAIAVWQGGDGNVGGRKRYSEWIEFRVESIS